MRGLKPAHGALLRSAPSFCSAASKGKLAAVLLIEIVESWAEIQGNG
jgi:hypothetical protein